MSSHVTEILENSTVHSWENGNNKGNWQFSIIKQFWSQGSPWRILGTCQLSSDQSLKTINLEYTFILLIHILIQHSLMQVYLCFQPQFVDSSLIFPLSSLLSLIITEILFYPECKTLSEGASQAQSLERKSISHMAAPGVVTHQDTAYAGTCQGLGNRL